MRLHPGLLATAIAVALPSLAGAQHSHGGGMEPPPRREKQEHASPPAVPRGLRPPGSAREIEILVVSYGFSPTEIRAEQGEEVVLRVRRSTDAHCTGGLAIAARQVLVQLPLDETIPVTLKLDRPEPIELRCANEDVRASIAVAP